MAVAIRQYPPTLLPITRVEVQSIQIMDSYMIPVPEQQDQWLRSTETHLRLDTPINSLSEDK